MNKTKFNGRPEQLKAKFNGRLEKLELDFKLVRCNCVSCGNSLNVYLPVEYLEAGKEKQKETYIKSKCACRFSSIRGW